jgi:hypothetical protein
MKKVSKNRIRPLYWPAGNRQCCKGKRISWGKRALAVLTLLLMVLIGTIGAQETIEHGYFIADAQSPHPEVPRISASETKKLFDEGKLILINTMEAENYAADHIIGALSLVQLERQGASFPTNVILAFYCH